MSSEEKIWDEKIGGEYNTFRTYLYLLKVKKATARQVSRALGFSSVALADHHLRKIVHYKLAEKEQNGSYRVYPTKVGVLKFCAITGKWIVPYTFFYSIMFYTITGILAYLNHLASYSEPGLLIALMVSALSAILNTVETYRFYRVIPSA